MTYSEFMRLFPDSDACVEYLRQKFLPDGSECPGCGRVTKFHRIKSRAAYSCQFCGHQTYPTANTIFHKSTVSLQLWFWAIFLMSSTRCGISAKQLEAEIGVSYPTALRMFRQIRRLLGQDDEVLSGKVEADETFMRGEPGTGKPMSIVEHSARKTVAFAAIKRARSQRQPRVSVILQQASRVGALLSELNTYSRRPSLRGPARQRPWVLQLSV